MDASLLRSLLVSSALVGASATASAAIATYTPVTDVAEHSEIDLDVAAIMDALAEVCARATRSPHNRVRSDMTCLSSCGHV